MDDLQQFENIQNELKGTTVLPAPRVSRETIIDVLKTHTELIKAQRQDHKHLVDLVGKLSRDTKDNRTALNKLSDDAEKMRVDITTLFRLNNEFRQEMDEISEKVADLYVLKKMMNEQKEFVEKLSHDFESFTGEMHDFVGQTNTTMTTLEDSCKNTEFIVKELKDYVDHFGDNLFLSSNQITVETTTGFSQKPVNLTDILKQCNTQFIDGEAKAVEHDEKINTLSEELATKAPETILFNVATLEKKVGTIEIHLQKEEEQGIAAIRKACEDLTETVQTLSTELSDKIDRDSVGLIVHEKYEEIVRYLQDALQSSVEDENSFKQKADEIQEMVIALSNSKADRSEVTNMQELMVKSEALLKKVGAQMNIKDRLKDFVTRKEAETMLATKADKLEFDMQLQAVAQSSRKGRKLTPMTALAAGGLNSNMEDAITSNQYKEMLDKYNYDAANRPGSSGGPHGTVLMAVGHGSSTIPTGKMSASASVDFSAFVKNKKVSKAAANLPGNTAPGAFRTATEAGRPGGAVDLQSVQSVGNISQHSVVSGNSITDGYGRAEYPYVPPKYRAGYMEQSATTDALGKMVNQAVPKTAGSVPVGQHQNSTQNNGNSLNFSNPVGSGAGGSNAWRNDVGSSAQNNVGNMNGVGNSSAGFDGSGGVPGNFAGIGSGNVGNASGNASGQSGIGVDSGVSGLGQAQYSEKGGQIGMQGQHDSNQNIGSTVYSANQINPSHAQGNINGQFGFQAIQAGADLKRFTQQGLPNQNYGVVDGSGERRSGYDQQAVIPPNFGPGPAVNVGKPNSSHQLKTAQGTGTAATFGGVITSTPNSRSASPDKEVSGQEINLNQYGPGPFQVGTDGNFVESGIDGPKGFNQPGGIPSNADYGTGDNGNYEYSSPDSRPGVPGNGNTSGVGGSGFNAVRATSIGSSGTANGSNNHGRGTPGKDGGYQGGRTGDTGNVVGSPGQKGDHLAYLSGPIVGGGFNLQNHHLMRATPSSPQTVYQTDVEGQGMMIKGDDGRYYYPEVQGQAIVSKATKTRTLSPKKQ